MIIVTSLSPNHSCKDNQAKAIESWKQYGDCYSLNHPDEISKLNYDIKLIPTKRTLNPIIGRHLIPVHSILDFSTNDLLYLNSDIILKDLPQFKQDGITLLTRYDYTDNINNASMFPHGFDAFYIPAQFLHIFPPSIYALGAAWHDYWIPKWCILKNIPLYYPAGKFAFHKVHPVQYSHEEWYRIGEYFRWEFQLDKAMSVPQIATETIKQIRLACRA